MIAKTYKPGFQYFDGDAGALGLYGFMEGQKMQPGAADLPEADLKMIKDTLAQMQAGKFTRFDVFKGPLKDNKGKVIFWPMVPRWSRKTLTASPWATSHCARPACIGGPRASPPNCPSSSSCWRLAVSGERLVAGCWFYWVLGIGFGRKKLSDDQPYPIPNT